MAKLSPDEIEKRGIRKSYYLETRCDVLLRNVEVFERWTRLGLKYMFLGFESLDAEQLRLFRKRITPNENFNDYTIGESIENLVIIVDDRGQATVTDGDGGLTETIDAITAQAAWNGAGAGTVVNAQPGSMATTVMPLGSSLVASRRVIMLSADLLAE